MRIAATSGMTGPILFVTLVGFGLAGCDDKLSGTYLPVEGQGLPFIGSPYQKLEFGSETVDLTALGMTVRGTYQVDGKKVAMVINGQSIVFTMDDKGCLDAGLLIGKYCKK